MTGEGYKDPTADRAIYTASLLPEHIWELVKLVRRMLGMIGLELVSITVKDRKSKRKYV